MLGSRSSQETERPALLPQTGEQRQELLKPFIAEFIGTFMLVLTVGCVTLAPTPAAYGPLAIACTLVAMIYATGSVSGGHLNPAVTLATVLCKKESWKKGLGYVFTQLLAGLAAGFSYKGIFGKAAALGAKPGFAWWNVMCVEGLYTAMLVLVVLSCCYSKRNNPSADTNSSPCPNQFYALAIGFVIIAGGYGAGPISGAVFNPAVAFAIDISDFDSIVAFLCYAAYEVLGAIIGSLLFRLTRPDEFRLSPEELENYRPSLSTRLAGEYIGTFVVVMTAGLNTLGKSAAGPLSVAAALLCMIYSLGDVSGAHFNPAVTCAVCASGRGMLAWRHALLYVTVQFIAGICGALMYAAIHNGTTFNLAPKAPYNDVAAGFMELVYTFVLAMAVLACGTTKGVPTPMTRNFYFGLAISATVVAGGFSTNNISGGCLNPAISTGISISSTIHDGPLASWWRYLLCEVIAGLLAAFVFRLTHASEYARMKMVP